MKIWLDTGHEGTDTGAVACGLVERNINLVMTLACKEELEKHGVIVGMTRKSDNKYISLGDRCEMANKWGPHYFVSIHNNAGGGDGAEGIHSILGGKGEILAKNIVKSIHEETGQNIRRVFYKESERRPGHDYYTVIGKTNMPSIIVEGAFLDNDIIDTIEEQKATGRAVAHGILSNIGINIEITIATKEIKEIISDIKININKLEGLV